MTAGVMPLDGDPTCADPQYRPVVDASFRRGGQKAMKWVERNLCPGCPVREACLTLGDAEYGVWGGLRANTRSRRGFSSGLHRSNKHTGAAA